MKDEKRIINNEYNIIKEETVGGTSFYLAEKKLDDTSKEYITGTIDKSFASVGFERFIVNMQSIDYIEVAENYYTALLSSIQKVKKQFRNIEKQVITKDDCLSLNQFKTIQGKVVALKSDVLFSEYQDATHQLFLAKNGFGCSLGSRGNAVFAINLRTYEETRLERYEILGVVKKEKLPLWAKENLKLHKPKKKGLER